MKVALVHDWLTNMGGAEGVLCALRELYPEAPIYTSLFEPESLAPCLAQANVVTSFLQKLPRRLRKHQRLLPLMPIAFEQFDLSDYDLVISSSSACAKGVLTRENTVHICYCHTPMRYAWDMYHAYIRPLRGLKRSLAVFVLHRLRVWDYVSSQRVDFFLANSTATQKRIAKHYDRSSVVLHPPVDLERFRCDREREDFYLVVARLVKYKRVDLAVQACLRLGRRLIVIGTGEEKRTLMRMCEGRSSLIQFLGWQGEDTVSDYYSRARAFLFPGEEDFGITMVEAMASGCPVVAYGKGGAVDIVEDGRTGVLFDEQTESGLISAMLRLEEMERRGALVIAALRQRAGQFSIDGFKNNFQEEILRVSGKPL